MMRGERGGLRKGAFAWTLPCPEMGEACLRLNHRQTRIVSKEGVNAGVQLGSDISWCGAATSIACQGEQGHFL